MCIAYNVYHAIVLGLNRDLAIAGKGCLSVMHDRAVVITFSAVVDLAGRILVKVVKHRRVDITLINPDVIVAIWATLLMMQAC